MIRTLALKDGTIIENCDLDQLNTFEWFWVDFNQPSFKEISQLKNKFHFHPLSLEECLDGQLQRPRIHFFNNYQYIVLHDVITSAQKVNEINLFISDKFLITFHYKPSDHIDLMWKELVNNHEGLQKSKLYPIYKIIDNLVDSYLPIMHEIEETIEHLESTSIGSSSSELTTQLFKIRKQLASMRRSVLPMRDVIYKVVKSKDLQLNDDEKIYLENIDDHLLRLSQKIDLSREITTDIQDTHLSFNSYRMNSIMMMLTVMTSIFMPLTFIAGIYGMNFKHMPELEWRYSYFILLGFMMVISLSLFMFFKKKRMVS